jgi:hypothetical protein
VNRARAAGGSNFQVLHGGQCVIDIPVFTGDGGIHGDAVGAIRLDYTGNGAVLLVDPKTGSQLRQLHGVYAREFAFE